MAASGLTIVVLMGARRARDIARRLITAGLSPVTPAAVVTNVHRSDERTWARVLDQLGVEPVVSPSILVIGRAAARAVTTAEFDPRVRASLHGRHLAWQ